MKGLLILAVSSVIIAPSFYTYVPQEEWYKFLAMLVGTVIGGLAQLVMMIAMEDAKFSRLSKRRKFGFPLLGAVLSLMSGLGTLELNQNAQFMDVLYMMWGLQIGTAIGIGEVGRRFFKDNHDV